MRLALLLGLSATLGCGAPDRAWLARSPDGAHRAELRETERGQRLLVDDREVGAWRAVATDHLSWSHDRPVVPVRTDEGWHVLRGGELGPPHEAIGELRVDGEHVIYAALDARGWRLFDDGRPGPWHDTILSGSILIERGRLAYAARDDDAARVVDRGRRGAPFRHVDRLGFAGKAERLVYVAYDDSGARIVDEGRAGDRFDAVHELARVALAPRWAAIVEGDGVLWLDRDGERTELPRGARGLALSDDGAHVAWLTPERGAVAVWLDGTRLRAHDEVDSLAFVPVTGALLYAARARDGYRVIHAGDPGPRFDAVDAPVTSSRGGWGYIGHRAGGSATVVGGEAVFRGEWAGTLSLSAGGWACVVRHAARRYVLTPAGQTLVESPFVDTLVLADDGDHWAIAVANTGQRELRIVVDGDDAAALSMDELSSELAARGDGSEAARTVVARELARVSAP